MGFRKRSSAMKPMRWGKEETLSELDAAGPLSKLFFLWVNPLMWAGLRRPLQEGDSMKLPGSLAPDLIGRQFVEAWRKELKRAGSKATFTRVIWDLVGSYALHAVALQLLVVLLKVGSIVCLRRLLQLVNTPDAENLIISGVVAALLLTMFNLLDGLVASLASFQMYQAFYGCQISCARAVLMKGSALHPAKQDEYRRGDLVTLAFSDFMRLSEIAGVLLYGLSAPMMLIVAFIFLFVLFGTLVLPAVSVSVFAWYMIRRLGHAHGEAFRNKSRTQGKRVGLLNELLQSIRFSKFYVLEDHYEAKFKDIRRQELKDLFWMRATFAMNWPCASVVPAGTAAIILGMHIFVYGKLPNNADLFTTLALSRFLYLPFAFFGSFNSGVNMFSAVIARVNAFLQQPDATRFRLADVQPVVDTGDASDGDVAVSIRGQSFSWSLDKSCITLEAVNLEVPQGELWVIVGELGSGKSSLLEAILGGINPVADSKEAAVNVRATSRAYVAQQPMIMNASLKQNVICSDEEVSDDALHAAYSAAALWPDLEVLPAGDQTEIGEKGITVSGGQKSRVAMARAVLASQPGGLVLLDDPLAAVDSHVGRHLFEECIVGALSGTTRLLVTNQLHFLSNPEVSKIVIMDSGRLAEQGTFAELTAEPESRLSLLLASQGRSTALSPVVEKQSGEADTRKTVVAQEGQQRQQVRPDTRKTVVADAAKLTVAEAKQEGAVTAATFNFYIQALGGLHVFAFLCFMSWLFHWAELGPDLFLAMWREDKLGLHEDNYLTGWLFCCLGGALLCLASRLAWCWKPITAAKHIHTGMLLRILHCPTSFFDRTPSGRIMNRFGEDQAMVDWTSGTQLEVLIIVAWMLVDQFIIVVVARPIVLPFVAAFAGCFIGLREVHRRASRETIRWWMVTKSQVFNIFEETLSGIPTIIAFGREDYFHRRFERAQLVNLSWVLSRDAGNLWTEQRLTLIGSSVVFTLALAIVLVPDAQNQSLAAISLIHALQIAFTMKTVSFFMVQVEGVFAAVERVKEFSEVEQEPPWHQPKDSRLQEASWPAGNCTLVFEKASLRYLPHMPRALDSVSFSFSAREKVGIVGRTGSGKSTVMGALFRLFELEEGRILLGGVDIKEVGLSLLRRQITIVPQDPILFSGKLRKNLDPLESKSDAQLWQSLSRCSLTSLVEALDGQLDAHVSEGGTNFSVGERQVLCLARALLRDGKVICLDEATANIDPTNDKRIQKVLSTEIADCLVLTIAHRLRTVIGSDRIAVLDRGKLAQLDAPSVLLRQEGIFQQLAAQAGISAEDAPQDCFEDTSRIVLEIVEERPTGGPKTSSRKQEGRKHRKHQCIPNIALMPGFPCYRL